MTAHLPVVLIHRNRDDKVFFLPLLQSRYRIIDSIEESEPESDPDVLALYGSVRIMLCYGLIPVTSQILDRYPSLEYVMATSAGVDHIDLAKCRRRGIGVTNTADIYSDDVADYAVALLIDVLRRISSADRFVRAGSWPAKNEFPLGLKVGGKRVGIVGYGNIGSRISKRLEAFNCIIAYTSRQQKPHLSYPYYDNILELAKWSDVVILCCSLTKETFHIANKNVLEALRKEGVIVNVGRGALVDEQEMVKFLIRGDIGGAGLDAFENEPNVPKELFGLDNVVLSPHEAVTPKTLHEALPKLVMKNLDAFFSNKPLSSEVRIDS